MSGKIQNQLVNKENAGVQEKKTVNTLMNAMLDGEKLRQAERIAASSRHMNLGGNPQFNENYMNAMLFPWEE